MPEWLATHAARRADAVALCYKRRGLWHAESWRALDARATALARGLAAHGFVPGDRLLVDAGPSPESLQVALAVLRLGGAIVSGESGADGLDATLEPRFAFADDDAGRARLGALLGGRPLALGIVRDGDDASDSSDASGAWLSLEVLEALDNAKPVDGAPARPPQPPAPGAVALIRLREALGEASAQPPSREREDLTHRELVRAAHGLLAAASIDGAERVLASRGLPLAAQLESVLGVWLVGGFALSFSETAASEDHDRRELGPHIVFGAERSFADLVARTRAALPSGPGLEARWISHALAGRGAAARLARRLVVRRLREVVGLGHLRRAIALDGTGAAAAGFEHLFGVAPLEWAARGEARATSRAYAAALDESSPVPLGASSGLGLTPGALGASSGGDLA